MMKDEVHSGTVARLCNVSADTIRHYERLGLIAAVRDPNGYRRFPRGTNPSSTSSTGILEEWDERLDATRDGEPALLLERLGSIRRKEER
jgi:MerR family regulatory protein